MVVASSGDAGGVQGQSGLSCRMQAVGAGAASTVSMSPRLVMAASRAHKPSMLYLKALHIISMVTWFAGLFYLPRLFVYHAMSTDAVSQARFCTMERKLYRGIMAPGAWATIACGGGLLYGYAWDLYRYSGWLQLKLVFVALTGVYHLICGHHLRLFARGENRRSHVYFRILNEVPVFFLVGIIILAVVKPF